MTKGVEDGMGAKASDKHRRKYVEMAQFAKLDDIAEAMMVRDAACAAHARTKRLVLEPSSQFTTEWLDSLAPSASPEQPSMSTGDAAGTMKEIRSNLAAIHDATIEQDHGIAILAERCLKLLDHIEGKGK